MMEVGFKSDKGMRRQKNEDACFVNPEQNVFLVADGVGGNNAGEIASRSVVSTVAECLRAEPLTASSTEADLRQYFLNCLNRANRTVFELSQKYPENKGMATTVTVLCLTDGSAYIVNVGDSRAYLFREGRLLQITEDHTYVNALVREGRITRDEASVHEKKNVITRAIGGENSIEPDFFCVEVKQNDILMLCTDGLYGEVEEATICQIMSENTPAAEMCVRLVDKANQRGGHDNITVVCVRV